MQRLLLIIISILTCSKCLFAQQSPADYVNMFMGVRGNSNCVIGPQLPHGSINPSPQTAHGGHGGYKEDQPVRGFAQLHVSGTGWGRYGQILLSPQRGFTAVEDAHDSEKADEVASPYYYKVRLLRYNVLTEIAPAQHSAFYRFTWKDGIHDDNALLLDVAHSLSQHIVPEQQGEFLGGKIYYDDSRHMMMGYGQYRGGFGSDEPYKVFFAIASEDFDLQHALVTNTATPKSGQGSLASAIPAVADANMQNMNSALYAHLAPNAAVCNLKIAVSLRSEDNAAKYIDEELGNKSLEDVAMQAKQVWNTKLSCINIEGMSDAERSLFYTTMYHSFVMPRDRTDDNPRFLGENIDDHYCVWDTWRTCFPLLILIDEDFVGKTIRSFLNRYEHDGKCTPTFTSSLEWDSRQGGDDVENVIADAMVKSVRGFDYKTAYLWLRWSATHNRSREYQSLGWQPEVDTIMSCSNALEYAYNDYCVAQAATLMGDKSFARKMKQRASSWQKLFNPDLADVESAYKGFVGPRRTDGEWLKIDPRHGYGSWVEYFYEGNSWTYSLFVPHQFDKLIAFCGGRQKMVERLQYGFDHGLIALWNEPGFLSPFIFTHCNRPDLTAEYVGRLRRDNFSLERGYCDNEDSGAMASWYIFTTLGLFPNAGQDFYYLLPPAYRCSKIQLSNGNSLVIERRGEGNTLKQVSINGQILKQPFIRHRQLIGGGTLIFEMTER